MPTRDEARAALLILSLAAAGLAVRVALGPREAPGEVGFRLGRGRRPEMDSVAARSARLSRPLGPRETIDIDKAEAEELIRLPRIGPGLAVRIVADRERNGPFASLEAVGRVPGVGPKALAAIEPHAVFSARRGRSGSRSQARRRVSLNTATAEELAQLPGIGPVRAQAIVDDRRRNGRYRKLSDLVRVRGIGPTTLERLATLVSVP